MFGKLATGWRNVDRGSQKASLKAYSFDQFCFKKYDVLRQFGAQKGADKFQSHSHHPRDHPGPLTPNIDVLKPKETHKPKAKPKDTPKDIPKETYINQKDESKDKSKGKPKETPNRDVCEPKESHEPKANPKDKNKKTHTKDLRAHVFIFLIFFHSGRGLERQSPIWQTTENASLPQSTRSRNSNFSVPIQIHPSSQFEFVLRDTEESGFLDLADFGCEAFSVESVV